MIDRDAIQWRMERFYGRPVRIHSVEEKDGEIHIRCTLLRRPEGWVEPTDEAIIREVPGVMVRDKARHLIEPVAPGDAWVDLSGKHPKRGVD